MLFHILSPSRAELCPQDGPMTCSGTYIVTQADVDSGKCSNTADVTSKSPDGKNIPHSQEKTVVMLGSATVTIGEALCLLDVRVFGGQRSVNGVHRICRRGHYKPPPPMYALPNHGR